MDQSWRNLEYWERLRWARMHSPFETQTAAAESMGMKVGTYSAYERSPDSSKHIKMDHQAAARFARKFKVRWEWLLAGEGEPWLERPADQAPTPTDRVIKLLQPLPPDEQDAIVTALEALSRARGKR